MLMLAEINTTIAEISDKRSGCLIKLIHITKWLKLNSYVVKLKLVTFLTLRFKVFE